jgi:hypothetical protein
MDEMVMDGDAEDVKHAWPMSPPESAPLAYCRHETEREA